MLLFWVQWICSSASKIVGFTELVNLFNFSQFFIACCLFRFLKSTDKQKRSEEVFLGSLSVS